MPSFYDIRGFRGFSPNQRYLDGDVTNAYLAADPSFLEKFSDASDAQNCVFYSIKFLSIRIYTDLVISKV